MSFSSNLTLYAESKLNSTFKKLTSALDQLKTKNWSVDNFKKYVTSVRCILEPLIQSFDTGQRIPFQLTITWMSNTKLNTDSIVSYASD